jgi:hypothetical protein
VSGPANDNRYDDLITGINMQVLAALNAGVPLIEVITALETVAAAMEAKVEEVIRSRSL